MWERVMRVILRRPVAAMGRSHRKKPYPGHGGSLLPGTVGARHARDSSAAHCGHRPLPL